MVEIRPNARRRFGRFFISFLGKYIFNALVRFLWRKLDETRRGDFNDFSILYVNIIITILAFETRCNSVFDTSIIILFVKSGESCRVYAQ